MLADTPDLPTNTETEGEFEYCDKGMFAVGAELIAQPYTIIVIPYTICT